MARIEGVSRENAGLRVRLAYFFTRRQLARLTGREPERIIEPLELHARAPELMFAYGKLEAATAKQNRVDWRLKVLAGLKAARTAGVSRLYGDTTASGLTGEPVAPESFSGAQTNSKR